MDNTQNKARDLTSFYTEDIRVVYTLKNKFVKECNLIFQVYNVFNNLYSPYGNNYASINAGTFTSSNYYFPMAGTNVMAAILIMNRIHPESTMTFGMLFIVYSSGYLIQINRYFFVISGGKPSLHNMLEALLIQEIIANQIVHNEVAKTRMA